MYLLVQNPGVAPVEGYTLLGVSTTRNCGVAGTIGQFGSGAKHAINTLLRAGLKLLDLLRQDPPGVRHPRRYGQRRAGDEADQARGLQAGRDEQQDARHGLVPGLRRDRLDRPVDGPAGVRGQRHRPHRAGAGRLPAGALERRPAGRPSSKTALSGRGTASPASTSKSTTTCSGSTANCPAASCTFPAGRSWSRNRLLPKADRNLNGKRTAMIYKEGVLGPRDRGRRKRRRSTTTTSTMAN